MPKRLVITNCRLFDAADASRRTAIVIEDGKIIRTAVSGGEVSGNTLDAGGRIAAPGYIDVHIQGAGGSDVLDATPEAFQAISRTCARYGVTSFLATTVYRPRGDNRHIRAAAEMMGETLGGANLLGLHLEGPFIAKRGMIRPDCVGAAAGRLQDRILEECGGHLRIMTIAPEVPQGLETIRRLRERQVVASFGHSGATYEQTLAGIEAGISHVTHLFNVMAPIHHRLPGPLAAIFESPGVICQLITDGVHVHPAVVRMAYRLLGAQRVITITDGMQAMGLPDGKYLYAGIEYEAKAGTARYADGTLIGTAVGLSELVKRLVTFTGCSAPDAIRTVTENPARALGVFGKKGCIAAGADADLVLLESDLAVHKTIVGGEVVFGK